MSAAGKKNVLFKGVFFGVGEDTKPTYYLSTPFFQNNKKNMRPFGSLFFGNLSIFSKFFFKKYSTKKPFDVEYVGPPPQADCDAPEAACDASFFYKNRDDSSDDTDLDYFSDNDLNDLNGSSFNWRECYNRNGDIFQSLKTLKRNIQTKFEQELVSAQENSNWCLRGYFARYLRLARKLQRNPKKVEKDLKRIRDRMLLKKKIREEGFKKRVQTEYFSQLEDFYEELKKTTPPIPLQQIEEKNAIFENTKKEIKKALKNEKELDFIEKKIEEGFFDFPLSSSYLDFLDSDSDGEEPKM